MKNVARLFLAAGCVLGSASMVQAGTINVGFEDLAVAGVLELDSTGNAVRSQLVSIQPGNYEDELSAVVADGSNTLEFSRGAGTTDSLGAVIDNGQVTSVPDSGVTAALFGLALAGLACFRKMAK